MATLTRKNTMMHEYSGDIPVSYKIAFYIESKEPSRRDEMMRALDMLLRRTQYYTTPDIFPIKFCYIPRTLITPAGIIKYLRKHDVPEEEVKRMAEYLYFSVTGEIDGGFLVMRLVPYCYAIPDHMERLGDFLRVQNFDCENIEDATDALEFLLQEVAHFNAYRLSCGYDPDEDYSGFSEESLSSDTMKMVLRRPDIDDRDKLVLDHAAMLEEFMEHWDLDDKRMLRVLERAKNNIMNKGKLKEIYPLYVNDKGEILYNLPSGKTEQCKFERGLIGNALYILFLRQIERADADKTGETPRYICPNLLPLHYGELMAIYEEMCPSGEKADWAERVRKLIQNPGNERSHINTYFYDKFDYSSLHPKHYSIEPVGKNSDDQVLLEVGLDVKDFDLKYYSIHRLGRRRIEDNL